MRLRADTRLRIAQAQDLAVRGMRTVYPDQVRAPRAERDTDPARTPALLRAGRYLAQPPPRRRTPGKPARPAPPVRRRRLTPAQARRLCRKAYVGAPDRAAFIADITAQALAEQARADRLANRRAAAAAKRAATRFVRQSEALTTATGVSAAESERLRTGILALSPDAARYRVTPAKPGDPAPGRKHKRARSSRKARR